MKSTISILCHTALPEAKACLASVQAGGGDFDLILTANGNADASAYFHELADYSPNIRVVTNLDNMGFIEPNRVALSMTETPLFVLLNDDAIVPHGWLDKIQATFAKHENAALVGRKGGCTMLKPDGIGTRGPFLDYIDGACLACRTDLVKKHGLFSPELSMAYFEDSDLSLRMRELGHTIHQAPFTIEHKGGTTSRTVPGLRSHFQRNQAWFQQRWSHYLTTRTFASADAQES